MPLASNWTDERCTQLDELWAAGFSASLIADKIGGLTRNAVIGKVHRRGLARRAKSPGTLAGAPAVMKIRRGYTARRVSVNRTHREMTTVQLVAAPPVEINDSEIPVAQRKTFAELKNHHCRWPIGEGADMFFCGAPANYPFASYCAHHRKRSRDKRKKFTGERGGSYRLTIGKYA